ncbi:MAG: cytochrome b [Rhodoplanes sp.]
MTAGTIGISGGEQGYTLTARVLHWVTAVIVIGMIPAGIYMINAQPGPTQDLLFHLHRSFGVLLLPIMIVRLVYRLAHPPPPLPDVVPAIQRSVAHIVHWALYALLIVQPIVGWIGTSAYRAPILVFWLFEPPPIWPVDRAFSERMFLVHRVLGLTIAFLAVMHIAAALYHHFIRKDAVLMRMLRA